MSRFLIFALLALFITACDSRRDPRADGLQRIPDDLCQSQTC